ncbi:MAG: hypothetical protein PUP91_30265 [Rhizonema sp. PD37]|nr:hypothetical protein [Rhizonema sp. PD37]
MKINQGLDDQLQDRFNQLIAKRQALTITDAELEELIQLTDRIEQLDAERIESLTELARLRRAIAHRSDARFKHSTACLCLRRELLPSNAGQWSQGRRAVVNTATFR